MGRLGCSADRLGFHFGIVCRNVCWLTGGQALSSDAQYEHHSGDAEPDCSDRDRRCSRTRSVALYAGYGAGALWPAILACASLEFSPCALGSILDDWIRACLGTRAF